MGEGAVASTNGEGSSHRGLEPVSFVDGRACARLSAKPPNDPSGDGLLQEDGGRLPSGTRSTSLL